MKFVRDNLMVKVRSRAELRAELSKLGLSTYYKDNIPMGIEDTDGKKHTWKKLGITPEMFQALDRREEMDRVSKRLDRLEKIHQLRQRAKLMDKERER